MKIFIILTAITFIITGIFSKPSELKDIPNTATLVYLAGFIILAVGLKEK